MSQSNLKKQLAVRTEKDPQDYIGIMVDGDSLLKHADGYFVGYANHNTVLVAWDTETLCIKQIHHAYVDEYNV